MNLGWQCPVCGKVWGPYWPSCDCGGNPNHNVKVSTTTECQHSWDYADSGTSYVARCRNCGATKPVSRGDL
jgi:hypothetical protein